MGMLPLSDSCTAGILQRCPPLLSAFHKDQRFCCLHADLKGGNVLLKSAQNPRGFEAKVADFGLARQLGIESRVQSNKYGTVTHCPPELLVDGTVSKVGKMAALHTISSVA